MTKQVLKNLESLIKGLNEKNAAYGYEYEAETMEYCRERYSMYLYYEMIFSLDMDVIMKFALDNGLSLRLAVSEHGKRGYIDFQ